MFIPACALVPIHVVQNVNIEKLLKKYTDTK